MILIKAEDEVDSALGDYRRDYQLFKAISIRGSMCREGVDVQLVLGNFPKDFFQRSFVST